MKEKAHVKIFVCSHCDAQFTKWIGRCLTCGQWGTVAESQPIPETKQPTAYTGHAPVALVSIAEAKTKALPRTKTKIGELDRVLGGGLVAGSLILIGGEPGIGKSTLALSLAASVPQALYLSGEESVEQIELRATRLQIAANTLRLGNAVSMEAILATAAKEKPPLMIIDSIQTITSETTPGEAGSVNQVRACAVKLLEYAKSSGVTMVLIGHVTKDGAMAGPKTLEHLVDTVLYFEGDHHRGVRILRAVKNRFGNTDEVGIFTMSEIGLVEESNPSALFLQDRGNAIAGSILTCLMEGTRPLLVEIQALVHKTVFGYPVRKASGFDLNRLHVLVAVLQKRAGLNLSQYDIHLNVVGGIHADEPAADLAVCLAIASAYKDKIVGSDLAAFGEVGLGGEVRSVSHLDKRIRECSNLGLKRIILSKKASAVTSPITLISVQNIEELITHAG